MAEQQAGWYPDPSGDASKLRYWDGTQWTNDFTDAANAVQPAEPEAPAVQPEAQPAPDTQPVGAPPAPMSQPTQPMDAAAQASQPLPPTQPPMQPQATGQMPIPVQPQDGSQPAGFAPAPGGQTPMQPPMYAPTTGAQPKKSRTGLIVGIVIAAVVVIALIAGVVALLGSNSGSGNSGNGGNSGITNSGGSSNSGSASTGTGTNSGDDPTEISGDVTGVVGEEYETMWFTFTVDSMTTAQSYADYTAAPGNTLVIAHITETNISGSSQPFGTFDWFVDDSSLTSYIYPLDPINSDMMPKEFTLSNKETASYDVVIEYPSDLAKPYLMYIEVDEYGTTYTTFKIPIK